MIRGEARGMNESAFFQNLAMTLAIAGVVSAVFSRLKWPKAIGYILAGVLLSRHIWGASLLADELSLQTIGQLGIVFLMFSMGLDFSASEMKKIQGVTIPTALLDTAIMVWLGYTVGRSVFGWGTVPSLFLGAAICDSATTLLAKIIGEMRWTRRPFVRYVLGTSVCEDVICVGVIALITGVAQGRGMSFGAVGLSLGGLFLFFLATIFFGFVLVPRLFVSVSRHGDDESLLLTTMGCCFFVTYLAYRLQFSLALGAFLVGIIGAGSTVRDRIRRLSDPLRALFAAVFFVSIGLLVDPVECFHQLPKILALSAVVIVGKGVNCLVGALAVGSDLKMAVQMSFSLAQIGEFAFMVALLYLTITGDAATPMFPVVIGVSLLTTLLNPLLIRFSDSAGDWAVRKCPVRIRRLLDAYRGTLARYRGATEAHGPRRVVRACVFELAVLGALIFAVAIACWMLGMRDWSRISVFFDAHKRLFFCLLANAVFLVMSVPAVRIGRTLAEAVVEILVGKGEAGWQIAVLNVARLVILLAVVGLVALEILLLNVHIAPDEIWARLAIAALFIALLGFGWRFFAKASHRAAVRFNEALQVDERLATLSQEVLSEIIPEESVGRFEIPEGASAVGRTVASLNVRAETGASVVSVERAGVMHRNIGPDWEFAAGDVVIALGDAAQKKALGRLLGRRP